MIKELALGSGLLLMPQCLGLLSNKKPIQIIVIGGLSTIFMKEFYERESNIHYTYIGWQEYNPFLKNKRHNSTIEIDLVPIVNEYSTYTHTCQRLVIDTLLPGKNYVFVTNLMKPHIALSSSILNWVKDQSIDFRFFGTTPLFNTSLIKIARFSFQKFENDNRVKIIDTNGYLNKMNGGALFTEAMEEFDKKLTDELHELCLSF